MSPISISGKRPIFENEFLRLFSVRADFGEMTKEYYVTERGTRAGVLISRNEHILLVRQYRFLINDYSWEIPGGGVHDGESPAAAATRECLEEAGIVCHVLVPLFDYRLGTDVTDSTVFLFHCADFAELPESGDGKETDAREWVPTSECFRRAMGGEIPDLMTVVALLVHRCKESV